MVNSVSDSNPKSRIILAILLVLIIVGPAGYVDYQNSSAFLISHAVLGLNGVDLLILIGTTLVLIFGIFLIYENESKC